MEIVIFLISIVIVFYYIFKPITKFEEKNFKNKNNWRGGF